MRTKLRGLSQPLITHLMRALMAIMFTTISVTALWCAESPNADNSNKWLLFRGTPNNAGATPAALRTPLILKWKFQPEIVARRHRVSPVTDGEYIYYAAGRTIYAIDIYTGAPMWQYDTPQSIVTPMALSADLLFAGTTGGQLFALKAKTGVLEWTFEAPSGIGVPPIVYDDFVLVATRTGTLHVLDAHRGDERTSVRLPGAVLNMPAVGKGWLAVVTSNRRLLIIGLTKRGRSMRMALLANSTLGIGGAPTEPIVQSPYIFIGMGRSLYWYDVRWRRVTKQLRLAGISWGAPALYGGVVYIATRDGTVHAVDVKAGKLRWKHALEQPVYTGISVSKGVVWVPSARGLLYALDADTGKLLWRFRLGDEAPYEQRALNIYAPPVITNNGVYIVSQDGSLYAFSPEFIDTSPPQLVVTWLRVPSRERGTIIAYRMEANPSEDEILELPGHPPIRVTLVLADAGSGINPKSFQASCTRIPNVPMEFEEPTGALTLDIHVPKGRSVRRALPDGEYTVTVSAADYMGNRTTYSFKFRINNSLPLPEPPARREAPSGVPGMPGVPGGPGMPGMPGEGGMPMPGMPGG